MRWIATIGFAAAVGCGQFVFPEQLPISAEQAREITANTELTPQERRDQLVSLGVDDVTINGLMENVRLGNQFGGTLATARAKVLDGNFTALTPDEVQFYGDATGSGSFSDAEADDIQRFLVQEQLDTAEELQDWLDDSGNELPTGIDQGELVAVFIDADPDDTSILNQLP